MEFLLFSHNLAQKLNFDGLLYVIILTYVSIAAIWTGRLYVIAVDYDSYIIARICTFDLNKSKCLPCECVKFMAKGIKRAFRKFLKIDYLIIN
jgi:hypothetical protein